MTYRVDNIPWPAKPFYLAICWALGALIRVYYKLCYFTCRIEHIGRDRIPNGPVIYCLWHSEWWPYFAVFHRHKRHIWINHPAAYMKPIHVSIRMSGVERLILGSEGREGAKAALELTSFLKAGYSTTISPDGPDGPLGTLKPGVIHIAERSGVPIVALRFKTSFCFRVATWDRKRFPLPFSRIEVWYSNPFRADLQNFEKSAAALAAELGTWPNEKADLSFHYG